MATGATFTSTFKSDSRSAQQDQQQYTRVLAATEKQANELERELKEGERAFRRHGESAKKAARDAKAAGKQTKQLTGLLRSAKGLIAGLGIGIALSLIRRGLTTVNDLWNEQRLALAQVEQGVRSTGMAAGLTAEQIADMARELQKATGIGDESILRLQGVLLTFTNITEPIFARTTELVLDLAERMQVDAKAGALQLGKALNDPIKNLSALSRAGIQFTEQQLEQIKGLVKSNQLLAAQKIILGELETQFGGSARAARDLDFRSLAAESGDFLEQIGRLVEGPMSQFVKGARDMVGGVDDLLTQFNDWREDQAEINRLLEEYVPRVNEAADGTGRFADEVQRAAIQQKVLILVNQLAKAFDELAASEERVLDEAQAMMSGGGFAGLGGTGGIAAQERVERLGELVEILKGQLFEARGEMGEMALAAAAAGLTLKEYEQAQREAAQETDENTRSQKELEKALRDVEKALADTFKRIREDVSAERLADDLRRALEQLEQEMIPEPLDDIEIPVRLDDELLADDVEQAAVAGWAAGQSEILNKWGLTAEEMAEILEERLAGAFDQLLDGFAASFGRALADGIRGADLEGVGRQLAGGLGSAAGGALSTALGGGPLAGIAGAGVGALVDVALNEIVDFFTSTAQSFASGEVTLEGANARILEHSSAMDDELQQAIDVITGTFDQIIELIGGTPGRGAGFGLVIRDNGQIGAWVDGVELVVTDINDAISQIIAQLVLRSDIQGVSDTVRAALENFGGSTAEELGAVLQTALSIDSLGIEESIAPVVARLDELFKLAAASMDQLGGVGLDAVLTGPGGVVDTLRDAFDQLLGIEEPLEEQVERRFRALEAEVLITRASLLAMLASGQARQAEVEASVISSRVILEGAEVRRLSTEVEARSAQITSQAAIASATAWAAASDAINAAIAALDEMVFDEAALEQARRAGARAANASRRSERERIADRREDALLQLAITEALADGNTALAERLQAEADLEEQVARITELLGEEAGARFRAAQEAIAAAAAEQELAAARRDATQAARDAAKEAIESFEDLLAGPESPSAGAAQRFAELQAEIQVQMDAIAQAIVEAAAIDPAGPDVFPLALELLELQERMEEAADSIAAFAQRITISLIQDFQALGGELSPEQQEEFNRLIFESGRARLLEAAAILATNDLFDQSVLSFEEFVALIAGLEFDPTGSIQTSLEAIQQAAVSLGDSLVSAIERFGGAANLTEEQRIALLRLEFVLIQAQLQIRRAELAALIAQSQELGIDTSSLTEGLGVIDDLLITLGNLEPDFAALATSTAAAAQAAADAAQAATTGADRWATALAAAERIRDFITARGAQGPFGDIFSRFDEIRDLFETDDIQIALRFLGLSVEEASGILDAMERAEIDERIMEIMSGVDDAIRQLTEGPLSGQPVQQQIAAGREAFLELAARAAAGDAEAARQVGQQGLDLVRLAEQAGPAQERAIRALVEAQLRSVRGLFPEAALRSDGVGIGAADLIDHPFVLSASDIVTPVPGRDLFEAFGSSFLGVPIRDVRREIGIEELAAAVRAQTESEERHRRALERTADEDRRRVESHRRMQVSLGDAAVVATHGVTAALSATPGTPSSRRIRR